VSLLLVDYVKYGLSSGLIQPMHFLTAILITKTESQQPLFFAPKINHYSCLLDLVKQTFKESLSKIVDTTSDISNTLQITINIINGLDFNIDRLIEWLLGQQQSANIGITSNYVDSTGYKNALKSLYILSTLFEDPRTLGLLLLCKEDLPSLWKLFEGGVTLLINKHQNVSFFLDIWSNLKSLLKLIINAIPSSFTMLNNIYIDSTDDTTLLPSSPLTLIDMLLEEDVCINICSLNTKQMYR
jgi:hypothetical protein